MVHAAYGRSIIFFKGNFVRGMLCIPLTIPLLTACASAKFNVPDEQFFMDGHPIDASYVQFVESRDDAAPTLTAAERFRKNCETAYVAAGQRYRSAHPQAKSEGQLLTERFDKNAGCTVRVAFRKES